MTAPSIVWFRQDLRLADQAALAAAVHEGPIVALYVLDDEGPRQWRMGGAQRWWLHHSLAALAKDLGRHRISLILRRGPAAETIAAVAKEAGAARVHAIRHVEPWWQAAEAALADKVDLVLHEGQQLANPDTIRTQTGGRYRVFTPFWRALAATLPPAPPLAAPEHLHGHGDLRSDRLEDWQLLPTKPDWAGGFDVWTPGEAGAVEALEDFADRVATYDHHRNLPSIDGSSRFSPHLHFGEISPAAVWHAAHDAAPRSATPFLREVGWRDFTANLVDLFPGIGAKNGRDTFDRLPWRTGAEADRDFAAWTKGRTGYPIVDAGMRQLWGMGWMHNRVRMITASFLTKHLLLDWRRGERWFWDTLVDADYGNNSVNWQWIAGTGIDSNPFGRIMAPLVQSTKFDAADYIREWVPELRDLSDATIHDPHGEGCAPKDYPEPLIGHREGRERALAAGAKVRA
ncbi:deoxyribodipyrimidine photo-lyase [Sphingomonas sp. BIUV-7]|uniref:Deoxyribodipyrimidine photo-lyase n=1 Tax=Sphingomonas natans TaxID=3063330 RepID=A0ABT8YBQ9_9SPHN|nr:deoxyribodipyrimidine photo-lyase [Sphingomonas sp. BIUV-7]MDO6415749.1 deoxyribodipyrimidine photo-lyase [Sphingomonas sp. BIUV-7]